MPLVRIVSVFALALTLSACLKTHRIDIQQGNVITESEVTQLEPGMTKREVRYVLGTPLVVDPFHQNRWEYYYSLDRRGEEKIKRLITVVFENDKLKNIEGDIGINTENSDVRNTEGTIITESQQVDKGFIRKTWDKIWGSDDE